LTLQYLLAWDLLQYLCGVNDWRMPPLHPPDLNPVTFCDEDGIPFRIGDGATLYLFAIVD